MIAYSKKFLVDEKGDRIGIFLDIEDYRKLLDELEELESIRAYDAAKVSGDEPTPFDQAAAEIERESK